MTEGKYVSYLRVSTAKQGASGLGLEAQRMALANFLNGGRWSVIRELVEVESGKRDDRPKLAEAMSLCRLHDATLVVAKLDRLSRDAAFLMNLQKAGVKFIAADMPEANEMTVGIMAVVAQAERKAISKRTKEALAAKANWYALLDDEQRANLVKLKKAVKLGGPKWDHLAGVAGDKGRASGMAARQARARGRAGDLLPILGELRAEGIVTLAGLATALTERGIPTSRGADRWSPMQVSRVLKASANDP